MWIIDYLNTLADPGGGGTLGVHPPKGPDFFILTYKFYEVHAPLREILDPPLLNIKLLVKFQLVISGRVASGLCMAPEDLGTHDSQ